MAGLHRIDMGHRVTSPLSSPTLMHAVGQGALAVEIRRADLRVKEALRGLGHWETEWRVAAERGLLRVLEGGCSVPVGVESSLVEVFGGEEEIHYEALPSSATFTPLGANSPTIHFSGLLDPSIPLTICPPALRTRRAVLTLKACVTSLDGTTHVLHSPPGRIVTSWREAEWWGEAVARALRDSGAKEVLEQIEAERKEREKRDWDTRVEKSREEAEAELKRKLMEEPQTPGLSVEGFDPTIVGGLGGLPAALARVKGARPGVGPHTESYGFSSPIPIRR
jgi:hydroxymethylbilane synthase